MPSKNPDPSGVADLFRAVEFAHYAERFRDKLFVVALPDGTPLGDLLLDLKVLAGYRIQVVLVLADPALRLREVVAEANKRGARFHFSLAADADVGQGGAPALDLGGLRSELESGKTPVIACRPVDSGPLDGTFALAGEVAERLAAHKLFLVGPEAARLAAAIPRTHVLAGELEGLRQGLAGREGSDLDPLLDFVAGMLTRGVPDIVLLEGRSGDLYREVFTHDGAGVLFNAVERSRVRRAKIGDVTDITLLTRPEAEAGRIRPVEESEIEANIDSYWVYDIDGLLVGLARLKPFGEVAELAQFATLPRYRGKGRARELAQRLVDEAAAQGFRRVFALSVDPRMWDFFRSLDFQQVDRDALPENWQKEYDLARPSRAFLKEL
ncbi:MAG: GNAT family N-acetyltransferase [bacterium]